MHYTEIWNGCFYYSSPFLKVNCSAAALSSCSVRLQIRVRQAVWCPMAVTAPITVRRMRSWNLPIWDFTLLHAHLLLYYLHMLHLVNGDNSVKESKFFMILVTRGTMPKTQNTLIVLCSCFGKWPRSYDFMKIVFCFTQSSRKGIITHPQCLTQGQGETDIWIWVRCDWAVASFDILFGNIISRDIWYSRWTLPFI